MAAPKANLVNAINNSNADSMPDSTFAPAPVPADGLIVGDKHGLHYGRIRKSGKTIDKTINLRNAFIALIVMLILLFTLQSPVCCGDAVTSEPVPQPVHEQPQRPEQAPIVDDQPVTAVVEKVMKIPVYATAINEQITTENTITAQVKTAETATLELADITTAAESALTTTGTEKMKTDAATTLATENRTGFVKLAYSGEILDEEAVDWECVEDRSNMLTWEVKKNDGGIRDRDHSYSWFSELDGVKDGIDNGGRCKGGVSCDTNGYARAMNEQKLCGYSDWRLPTRVELETLIEYNSNPRQATINRTYFPEAVPSWYWTASEHPRREAYAWYILFRNGVALNDLKERPKHIRLVRGEILQR